MLKKSFDTSNYELEIPLLEGKTKKVIGLMKDDLGGKIMKEFVGLRAKTYSYLADDNHTPACDVIGTSHLGLI